MTHPNVHRKPVAGVPATEHGGKASAASLLLSALSSHGSCGTMDACAMNMTQSPPVPTALEPIAKRRWVLK